MGLLGRSRRRRWSCGCDKKRVGWPGVRQRAATGGTPCCFSASRIPSRRPDPSPVKLMRSHGRALRIFMVDPENCHGASIGRRCAGFPVKKPELNQSKPDLLSADLGSKSASGWIFQSLPHRSGGGKAAPFPQKIAFRTAWFRAVREPRVVYQSSP